MQAPRHATRNSRKPGHQCIIGISGGQEGDLTGCSAGATFSAGGGAAHPAVRRNRWRPCQGPAVHRSDGMPRAGQTLGPVDESPGPPFPSLEDTARPFLTHRVPGMERPGQAGRMSSLSRNAGSAWSRPARRAEGSSLRTERIERYAQTPITGMLQNIAVPCEDARPLS